MEIPLVQQLIRRKICLQEGMLDCEGEASVELINLASPWFGIYNITLSLITFTTGMWFGSWADKYGRKKMMVVPFIGSILSTLIFIIVSVFMNSTPLAIMFCAVISGLSTGVLGVCSTCFGIIGNVTSTERRSTRIAILDSMVFVGSAAGFYIVSVLLPMSSFVAIFTFELGLHFIGLIYVITVIQEPIEDRKQREGVSSSSLISLEHLVSMVRTVVRRRDNHHQGAVVLLTISSFMLAFGAATANQLTFTRLTSAPFGWSPSEYSSYHGLMVLIQGSALVLVLPLSLRFLNIKDSTTGLFGASSRLLGLAGLAFATKNWMLYATLAVFSLSEFAMPSLRSILSKIVAPHEMSQIFALMSAHVSMGNVLTGVILLFPDALTSLFPGFGIAMGAAVQVVPILSLLYLRYFVRIDNLPRPTQDASKHSNYGAVSSSTEAGELRVSTPATEKC